MVNQREDRPLEPAEPCFLSSPYQSTSVNHYSAKSLFPRKAFNLMTQNRNRILIYYLLKSPGSRTSKFSGFVNPRLFSNQLGI